MNPLAVATVCDWPIYFKAMALLGQGASHAEFKAYCALAVRKMAWFQNVQFGKLYTAAAHEAAADQVAYHWLTIYHLDNAS